jgi:hypothetical protein
MYFLLWLYKMKEEEKKKTLIAFVILLNKRMNKQMGVF